MKYNYPELKGKCKTCLGCNRLEDENFTGIWRCENYIEGKSKDEYRRNTESNDRHVSKY